VQLLDLVRTMFLIHYITDVAFISATMHMPHIIIGANNASALSTVRFADVIGALAVNTPSATMGLPNALCSDPVVKVIKGGLTNIIGVLTALGIAVAVVGIVVGGLMRATSWGSEQRIAASNKAISSAVIGLIIILLAVILGTEIPNWFNLQNNACPLNPTSVSSTVATPGSTSPSNT
jgi:hypothetical protein